MESSLVIRGRVITPSDIEQIKTVVKRHWACGRCAISRELCKLWDWRQPNGFLKEQVCRILLRQLEQKNLIELPPQKHGVPNRNRRYYVGSESPLPFSKEPITGGLRNFPPVYLKMVRREPEEHLWNYLIHQYHYKSYKIIVGSHLKYIAYMEEIPIACLAWCSSIFRIRCRDEFLGWSQKAKNRNIRYIANNSRFLILPWVRIRYLASHILAKSARILGSDWQDFYRHPLYLLETFVETDRFRGICYQAANWIRVGQTSGHAKAKGKFYYHGRKKDVYLYPLTSKYRKLLCRLPESGGRA